MNRRSFFAGLAALVVAPKVVKATEFRMPCGCRSATEHIYACPMRDFRSIHDRNVMVYPAPKHNNSFKITGMAWVDSRTGKRVPF